jgi:hypothetical protein
VEGHRSPKRKRLPVTCQSREASWSAPALWRFGSGANERRRALAKPMPACFATLLRPGTGALRLPGETNSFRAGRRKPPLPKSFWDGRLGQRAFEIWL